MPKHLVIVESPTKAKTIKRFLGSDFLVEACMGHVRDLPGNNLAVDVDAGFEAEYVIPDEKKSVVKGLQKYLDTCDELWIATDEDREGEAIGWHLTQVLRRKNGQEIRRIVFHEITEEAIRDAARHPREIDERLVEAQQARRILDRLVGYTLSPFLWKKVYRGLSAGRVQSVAVRIIVDREREVRAFRPEEYWTVEAELETWEKEPFTAALQGMSGKKYVPKRKKEADRVLRDLEGASFAVRAVEESTVRKTPMPPFTTSTLQQEAGRKLGFSVKQTMVVAQQLYEGVDMGKGEGSAGLITYMRTDSVHMSQKALQDAKDTIEKIFGREYILSAPRRYKTKSKGAQEAHEAIRPTEISRCPEVLKDVLDHQQLKLYTLIWNRTVATQMAAAELKRVGADIAAAQYTFRATGQTVVFDGYYRVYREGSDEEDTKNKKSEIRNEEEKMLPPMKAGDALACLGLTPGQHFTKPPPRFTEASLVKKLEEEGIGRPSTYAPTISTIQQRGYIRKEQKQLVPEEIAFTVTDLLAEHFADIVDLKFTAQMEQSLDDIAGGKQERVAFLSGFYGPYAVQLASKTTEIKKSDVLKEIVLGTDPATGLEVLALTGRFGPYVQLGRLDPGSAAGKKGGRKKGRKEKPRSASLPRGKIREDVTLGEALALLRFPRELGSRDGENISVNLGRFGPYIRWGKVTVSLPKEADPSAVSMEDALRIVAEAKDRKERQAEPLRRLGRDPNTDAEILVKEGRYGPYVTDGVKNASIPKKWSPETIDLIAASELIGKKRANLGRKKWRSERRSGADDKMKN